MDEEDVLEDEDPLECVLLIFPEVVFPLFPLLLDRTPVRALRVFGVMVAAAEDELPALTIARKAAVFELCLNLHCQWGPHLLV